MAEYLLREADDFYRYDIQTQNVKRVVGMSRMRGPCPTTGALHYEHKFVLHFSVIPYTESLRIVYEIMHLKK